MFKDKDSLYANYLLRCGLEDLDFAYDEFVNDIYTVRWGKPITSQTCGGGLIALSLAYKLTNNNKYLDIIEDFVNKVIATQETNKDVQQIKDLKVKADTLIKIQNQKNVLYVEGKTEIINQFK